VCHLRHQGSKRSNTTSFTAEGLSGAIPFFTPSPTTTNHHSGGLALSNCHPGVSSVTKEARWHSGELEEFGALRNVAARPAKFGVVVEHDFVFAVEPRQQLADGVEPHQRSPVDAHEQLGVE
jgi:hypothetical protein